MIAHHPSDELLLGAAAGTLDVGAAIVVGAHLEGCARCRASVHAFESAGGAMLESIEPALMAPEALARRARISQVAGWPRQRPPKPSACIFVRSSGPRLPS